MSIGRVSAILTVLFVAGAIALYEWPISNSLAEGTDHAQTIDAIFKFMLIASWAVFLIVQGFLLYFVVRYRRRKTDSDDALGANIHGNTRLEIVWSVIPTIFLVVLTAISWKVYADIVANHTDAYVINAQAFQFGWECDHPQYHITETSTCHMPVDRNITVNLHARDVIHSFWVPEFRVKQDALPGYPTQMHFKTIRVGQYRLICAELCGIGHSEMYAKLYVMKQADFAAWAKAQQQQQSGTGNLSNVSFKTDIETIFGQHCAACHISNQLGGLNLGNYQGLLKGGNVLPGPVVKPGNHKASYIWEITQPTPPWPAGNRMPLGGPYLNSADIARIAAWIDQGAKNN